MPSPWERSAPPEHGRPRAKRPAWKQTEPDILGTRAVPPADKSDPNAKESRTAPSGQVGRREAAKALAQSAARGRELSRLLDSDTPVPGVTSGALRPEIAAIAVPATADGRNMAGGDFALTAGWGHYGAGGAVMPGQGPHRRTRIHTGRTRRLGRRPPRSRRDQVRRVPERPRLLAQRPRRRLALQDRRLPSPQEVALLP